MGDTSGFLKAAVEAARRERAAQTSSFWDEDGLMPMTFFSPPTDTDWLLSMPDPPLPAREVKAPKAPPPAPELPPPKRPRKAGAGKNPADHDRAQRNRAIEQWSQVVERIAGSCQSLHSGPRPDASEMEDHMATKKTGTLLIRASAWRLFFRFADEKGIDTHDLHEADIYQYLSHLKKSAAPASRAKSFIQACGFAYGLSGFRTGARVMASPRCQGASELCLQRKRPRRQRNPFKAKWLASMEVEVFLAAFDPSAAKLNQQEATVAGFVIFLTHGRLRCSDGARIQTEPKLDEGEGADADLCSFIEAEMIGHQTKTGGTRNKADLLFPALGLAKGISGVDWAAAWMLLREQHGLAAEQDMCLMPRPLADGTFAAGRAEPGAITEWIRFLLEKLDVPRGQLTNVGSHSCKATLLSMAAKAGMSRDMRRTLGAHAIPGDKSVDAYSRDNLAAPLRELAKLLRVIRQGQFDPDCSRSGRWHQEASAADSAGQLELCGQCGEDLGARPCFRCECGTWLHCNGPCAARCEECGEDFCGTCEASHDHECNAPLADDLAEGDGFDESDADSDDVEMAIEEEEKEMQREETSKPEFLEKGTATAEEAAFPEAGIILNRQNGVAHKANADCKPACGTKLSDKNQDMHLSPEALEGMSLCWRRGCAPWQRAAVDPLERLLIDLEEPVILSLESEVIRPQPRQLWSIAAKSAPLCARV